MKPNGTSRTTLTTPKQIWFQTTWESPGINSSFIAEKTVNRQTGKVDWKRRSTSWNMAYWRVTTPRSPGGTAEPVIAQMKASGDHPVLVLRQLHNLATAKNCEMEVTISGVKIKASPTLPFREVIAPLIEKYPGFLKEL